MWRRSLFNFALDHSKVLRDCHAFKIRQQFSQRTREGLLVNREGEQEFEDINSKTGSNEILLKK